MAPTVEYGTQSQAQPAAGDPDYDLEKNNFKVSSGSDHGSEQDGAVPFAVHDDIKRTGKLWEIAKKLDRFGVEGRGIERIMPDERTQKSAWGCFWMWLAANCTISTFSLGTLGTSIWHLGLKDSALTILFFNLVFTLPAAYFSTFGPKTGLRQLALARFSFGYWVVLIPVVLNAVACIGWSTVNSIVGGQALRAVALDSSMAKVPVEGAVVIIGVCTVGFSFMGYKFVHMYEKYSWIPVAVIFLIYAIEIGPHVDSSWGGSGPAEAASVLSFGGAIAGFALGWSSLASDYSCNLPESTSSTKVFLLTYAGMNIPMITLQALGAAAMATLEVKTTWAAAYDAEGVGGLLAAPLIGPIGGAGRFFTLILALSIVANNIPNLYSFSLTVQVLGPWVQRIPRPFLVIVATLVYLALAIAGAHNFEQALDSLLLVLAYWLAVFCTIVCEEHWIFRKRNFANWNLEDIANARKLPFGVAALGALICGVAVAVCFMSQTWFVGPGAIAVSGPPFGTDLGFELAAVTTAIIYPILRYFEKKKWGC